jgi:hypothetical protein
MAIGLYREGFNRVTPQKPIVSPIPAEGRAIKSYILIRSAFLAKTRGRPVAPAPLAQELAP